MPEPGLSPLQRYVLHALADLDPPWVLAGGAALAGFYFHHRTTRDLDLFWRGRDGLGHSRDDALLRLRDRGLRAETIQAAPTFVRLRVENDTEVVVVDLVAEPGTPSTVGIPHEVSGRVVHVATLDDLFADKLCALLSRSELRDLVDVRELARANLSLATAISAACRRDAGFSPLTLAWVLRGYPVERLAGAAGWTPQAAARLSSFRDDLAARVAVAVRPS